MRPAAVTEAAVIAVLIELQKEWQLQTGSWKQLSRSRYTLGSLIGRRARRLDRPAAGNSCSLKMKMFYLEHT